jgi:hypothetical protein
VTQHCAGLYFGNVPFENVEIGSTDRRRVDANDRIGRLDDRWIRLGLPAF